MTIIETIGRAFDPSLWELLDECRTKGIGIKWAEGNVADSDRKARAALRAIKPEDVSDGMVAAAFRASDLWPAETQYINGEPGTLFRRAIAAALSAGAEQ